MFSFLMLEGNVVVVGSGDVFVVGGQDFEGVFVCGGGSKWKEGGVRRFVCRGVKEWGWQIDDRGVIDFKIIRMCGIYLYWFCQWCFCFIIFYSLGIRIEKKDSGVGLGQGRGQEKG